MVDEEGGGVQRMANAVGSLPWPREMAATMSPAAVQDHAEALGQALVQVGVNVDLAPLLDLDGGPGPDQTHPDGLRSFSPDPTITSTYGLAFIEGLSAGGVTAVAKGFPGEGPSNGNADAGPARTLPLAALQAEGDLRPFQIAIAAGVRAIMVSNVTVPGLTDGPASLSPAAITGLLRDQLGFHGLVITDALSAGAVRATGLDAPEAALAAIEAGADMVLGTPDPSAIVQRLTDAAASGELPLARLDEAVDHVLIEKGLVTC